MSPPQQQQIVEKRKFTYSLFGKAIKSKQKKQTKVTAKHAKKQVETQISVILLKKNHQ